MDKGVVTAERVSVGPADDWEDAVRLAAAPLVADGSVESGYIDTIVANVQAPGGTYMDLGFGFTLAHARPEDGVRDTAVAVRVLPSPVPLNDDPDHPMQVVVVLAARDTHSHQATMRQIAKVLTDPDGRETVRAATSPDQVVEVFTA